MCLGFRQRQAGAHKSVGWETEIFFAHAQGRMEQRASYAVLREPGNPGYYEGNLLIFDDPPQTGDVDSWTAGFEREFGDDPAVVHACFGWSGEIGSADAFVQRGYVLERRTVLCGNEVTVCAPPLHLQIRELQSDDDWHDELQMRLDCRPPHHTGAEWPLFTTRSIQHYRTLSQVGAGVWLGAFDGTRLAGSCGIFAAGADRARYRNVLVAPAYRRRGLARALVGTAAALARTRGFAREFVIVADAGSSAQSLYEAIGFHPSAAEFTLWISQRKRAA